MKFIYDKKARRVVPKPELPPTIIEALPIDPALAEQLEALQTMRRSFERVFGGGHNED